MNHATIQFQSYQPASIIPSSHNQPRMPPFKMKSSHQSSHSSPSTYFNNHLPNKDHFHERTMPPRIHISTIKTQEDSLSKGNHPSNSIKQNSFHPFNCQDSNRMNLQLFSIQITKYWKKINEYNNETNIPAASEFRIYFQGKSNPEETSPVRTNIIFRVIQVRIKLHPYAAILPTQNRTALQLRLHFIYVYMEWYNPHIKSNIHSSHNIHHPHKQIPQSTPIN